MTSVAVLGWRALMPAPVGPVPPAWEAPDARARLLGELGAEDPARPPDMSRWPRLDRYSRALAVAVHGALPPGRARTLDDTGLYVASERSCLETNTEFDHGLITKGPRMASPMLFPYTLPGSGASESALYEGLGGPYLVFPGGPASALAAVLSAVDALAEHEAPRLVVAAADVLGPHTLRTRAALGGLPGAGAPPLAEAAAAVTLAVPDDAAPGPRVILEGALGPSSPDWGDVVAEALERAGLRPSQVGTVIDASLAPGGAGEALEASLDGLWGPVRDPTLRLVWRVGEAGAALGVCAVLAGLEEILQAPGAVLVVAQDAGCSSALVLSSH